MVALLDHPVQEDFERHGMHAHPAGLEEFAVAGPFTLLVLHDVVVVIPFECGLEVVNCDAIFLFGISFRFFDFSDHSAIHAVLSSVSLEYLNKNTRQKQKACVPLQASNAVLLRGSFYLS